MKLLQKSRFNSFIVAEAFNQIIINKLGGYDGKKKEQLKSFFEDLQNGGCQSGLISDFVYNSDCKDFYIDYLDELEDMKTELEDELGEPIKNRQGVPHYTFICWLCFEEYCYDLYRTLFED